MTEKAIKITVSAEDWAAYQSRASLARAAKKDADTAWELLSLPDDGKAWAELLRLTSGEVGKVTVVNGNGIPLAAGQVSERINPPRPASVSWISPRL